jgi:hypothetical protein
MIRLTKAQFAQLVAQLESIIKHLKKQHALKGSGPDDYSFSQTLETYLYRHPMSMIEFWVDDGAVPMGGAGVRDWMKKKRKTLGGVMKRIANSLNRVKDEAKEEAEQMIKKRNLGKARSSCEMPPTPTSQRRLQIPVSKFAE